MDHDTSNFRMVSVNGPTKGVITLQVCTFNELLFLTYCMKVVSNIMKRFSKRDDLATANRGKKANIKKYRLVPLVRVHHGC